MAANLFVPTGAQAPAQRGNFEPAIGFINLYLPSKDGGRTKLGAIPLKASRDREKALFDALSDEAVSEDVVKAILGRLMIDFQKAEQGEGKHFDLGF